MTGFPGRVGIQQRVLTTYRVPFFDRLAQECAGGLEVFAGEPRSEEGIAVADGLRTARRVRGRNLHIGGVDSYVCWQRGLLAWVRRFDPDVLVAEANPRLLSTHAAVRVMHSRGRPVIGWGLGMLTPHFASGVRHVFHRRVVGSFFRSFDALIAYSSKGAADYVSAGVPPERVLVAPNAVSNADAEALSARLLEQPHLVERWRRDVGLGEGPAIVYAGRLIPQKRVDDLIRACSMLGDRCELLVAGDGPERPALESLAADVFPRARFLGHLEGQDLALAFGAADLFVLPGTGGLAVHEAMLYGKPVVVGVSDGTDVDLVREGANGFRLEPGGGVEGLERTIRLALSDPGALQQMGLESRRIATEEVSVEAMTDVFVRALHLAAGRRAGGNGSNSR